MKLVKTAEELIDNPYARLEQVVFIPSDFVHITFPYYDPGDVSVWTRKNGNQVFTIQPGTMLGESLGLPCGLYPRLLIHWLTKQLKLTSGNEVFLGDNLTEFMRQLKLDTHQGGKRSPRSICQKQLQRFFRAKYTTEYIHEVKGKKGLSYHDLQIAPKGNLWWDFSGDEENIFDGKLILSDEAATMFRNSTMPVDMRILYALKDSCMDLDYFNWLHLKTYIANRRQKILKVPWRGLIHQFGSVYGSKKNLTADDVKNFTKASKKSIDKILGVCGYLHISYYRGGISIRPAFIPLAIANKIVK